MGKRQADKLTAAQVRGAEATGTRYMLGDGRGLFLQVEPGGNKWWRFKYSRPGNHKSNTLSLGVYPDVSLQDARRLRDDARTRIAAGVDPAVQRRVEQRAQAGRDSFEAVAREWLEVNTRGASASTRTKKTGLLVNHLFPVLGDKPITSIEPPELLAVLRGILDDGHGETAHRAKSVAHAVFSYGIASGQCKRNPASDIGAALGPHQGGHWPGITDPVEFGELLRHVDTYFNPVIRAGLQLMAVTFIRPGELRLARWREIDWEARFWEIPPTRDAEGHGMKMKLGHIVPLARQAVAILENLKQRTDKGPDSYIYPAVRKGRPMSENTMNEALRAMGYRPSVHVPHGFRTSASTMLNEWGHDERYIEVQLAHKKPGVAGIYNRAKYLQQRIELMQIWADACDDMRAGKRVGIYATATATGDE